MAGPIHQIDYLTRLNANLNVSVEHYKNAIKKFKIRDSDSLEVVQRKGLEVIRNLKACCEQAEKDESQKKYTKYYNENVVERIQNAEKTLQELIQEEFIDWNRLSVDIFPRLESAIGYFHGSIKQQLQVKLAENYRRRMAKRVSKVFPEGVGGVTQLVLEYANVGPLQQSVYATHKAELEELREYIEKEKTELGERFVNDPNEQQIYAAILTSVSLKLNKTCSPQEKLEDVFYSVWGATDRRALIHFLGEENVLAVDRGIRDRSITPPSVYMQVMRWLLDMNLIQIGQSQPEILVSVIDGLDYPDNYKNLANAIRAWINDPENAKTVETIKTITLDNKICFPFEILRFPNLAGMSFVKKFEDPPGYLDFISNCLSKLSSGDENG